MLPRIIVCETREAFDRAAADWVSARISGEKTVLGLATGSSPVGLYRELVGRTQAGELSFRHVRTFNLDEYVGLSSEHPQCYRRFMNEHLFNHVDIEPTSVHIPDGSTDDPQREAAHYDELLGAFGPIDAQVLGVGTNGHIGFNEPGTPFTARTHVVQLAEETRQSNSRFFDSLDEVPTQAITMGIANILESREILLLAYGAAKAKALQRAFSETPTPHVPASALQLHANVTLLLDREAAAGMKGAL